MRFVDTNVLIYAVSPSAGEAGKRRRARELLREGGLAVSVQVLQGEIMLPDANAEIRSYLDELERGDDPGSEPVVVSHYTVAV